MSYYCDSCNMEVGAAICPQCSSPTVPQPASPAARRGIREALSAAARAAPRTADYADAPPPYDDEEPVPEPEPVTDDPAPRAAPETASRPAAGARVRISSAGRRQLEQYIDDGYGVYLIAGIGGSGKTELLASYRQNAYLSTVARKQGMVIPTAPGDLDFHPVPAAGRPLVFVDASGETFKQLYPDASRNEQLTESDVAFLRLVSRRLRGLVLLLDLTRLWGPGRTADPANARQVEILGWILQLMRWLRIDGHYPGGAIPFQAYVKRELVRRTERLDVPVLVLFSKADEAEGLPLASRGARGAPARTLQPVGEDPLLVAHHHLGDLYQALETHADHFRFDFAHSLVTDRDTGEIVESAACGVDLSLEWLLDPGWRWRPLPTRRLLALRRRLDGMLGRGRRWRQLPPPERRP